MQIQAGVEKMVVFFIKECIGKKHTEKKLHKKPSKKTHPDVCVQSKMVITVISLLSGGSQIDLGECIGSGPGA